MADAYLTFDTKMNTSGFKAGLGQLTGMFTKLAAVMGVALGVTALVQFGKAGVQAASEMGSKFKGLEFLMRANNRSMSQATAFIQEFTADGLVPMTSAYEAYKNMVSRGYDTSQIEQMLTVMKDAAVYNRQGQFSMGEAIEKATMGLRMENSLLTDSVGIQKNVAKMWQEYAKEIGTVATNLTAAQKRQAEFNGFMKEGGVFAGAAAEYTDSYAGRVSTLAASMLNLKIAVGNAVIPIINAVMPVLKRAVDWLTKAFNLIGLVMNELFGTNVGAKDAEALANNAQSGADAMGEMAANTEAAREAAKDALAAFDKLNVLAQADGGAADGGIIPIAGDQTGDGGLIGDLEGDKLKIKELIDGFKADVAELGWFNAVMQNIYEILAPIREWVKTNIIDPVQNFFAGLWEGIKNGFLTAIGWIGEQYAANWQTMQDVAAIAINALGALWQNLKDWAAEALNAIGGWFVLRWDAIKAKVVEVWTGIKAIWSAAKDWFNSAVLSPIGSFFTAKWAAIKLTVTGVWDAVKNAWSGVKQWFDTMVLTPIKTAFKTAWDAVGDIMKAPFIAIGKFVKGIINGLIGFLNGLIGGFERAINFIISALNRISVKIPAWVPLIGGNTFGVNIQPVSYGRIPYLATGAVIPPNAPFAAVLGDQRSGKNIEAPLKTIEQAVDNALAKRGAGAGGTISFDVDESGLMRYLHPKFTAETKRVGNSLARKAGAA